MLVTALPKWGRKTGDDGGDDDEGGGGKKVVKKKEPLGATFYNWDEAYKYARESHISTTINRNDRKTYIGNAVKKAQKANSNWRFYEVEKGEKIITKGASKGWK